MKELEELLKNKTKKELYNVIKDHFEDTFNPQHYYCRLRDLGINKKRSREIEKIYEEQVYKIVMDELKRYEGD